jgi:hypothetical protein
VDPRGLVATTRESVRAKRECSVGSDVGDFFSKRQSVARPAVTEERIASSERGRPGWAVQGTAFFEAIGRTLARLEPTRPPTTPAVGGGSKPLPWRRKPVSSTADTSWPTCYGKRDARVGDLVALSLLNNPDARGRIVGAADDGRPECVLGDFDDPDGRRPRLAVDPGQLLMVIRQAEEGHCADESPA